jgi:hypothetical protein
LNSAGSGKINMILPPPKPDSPQSNSSVRTVPAPTKSSLLILCRHQQVSRPESPQQQVLPVRRQVLPVRPVLPVRRRALPVQRQVLPVRRRVLPVRRVPRQPSPVNPHLRPCHLRRSRTCRPQQSDHPGHDRGEAVA